MRWRVSHKAIEMIATLYLTSSEEKSAEYPARDEKNEKCIASLKEPFKKNQFNYAPQMIIHHYINTYISWLILRSLTLLKEISISNNLSTIISCFSRCFYVIRELGEMILRNDLHRHACISAPINENYHVLFRQLLWNYQGLLRVLNTIRLRIYLFDKSYFIAIKRD